MPTWRWNRLSNRVSIDCQGYLTREPTERRENKIKITANWEHRRRPIGGARKTSNVQCRLGRHWEGQPILREGGAN